MTMPREPRRRLLTYDDLETEYSIRRNTAARYVKLGVLPHVRLGERGTRFDRAEIEAWIDARRRPSKSRP